MNKDAVEDAKRNAQLNSNTLFFRVIRFDLKV